ncbi:MAG: very short patch repair endonuclease [Bryobacteraceae bacterium]
MTDIYSQEERSAIMSRIRSRDTRPEKIVRATLHRLGLRFRLVASDLPGRPDIVLRGRRTVVFVNGCYWHRHNCSKGRSRAQANAEFWSKKIGDNVSRDRKNYCLLRSQGWRVAVVWECETKDIDKLRSKLAEEFSV